MLAWLKCGQLGYVLIWNLVKVVWMKHDHFDTNVSMNAWLCLRCLNGMLVEWTYGILKWSYYAYFGMFWCFVHRCFWLVGSRLIWVKGKD